MLPRINRDPDAPISLLCPFASPEPHKTAWVGGHQHYICGTWRGTMWHTTNYTHPRTSAWVLCVSADKRGVWSNSIGDMSGDPFDLPPEILARMPGVYA